MATTEPYLPRHKLPAQTFALPKKRAPNFTVGVYSPFAQTFHQHGQVRLEMGRKPIADDEDLHGTSDEPRPTASGTGAGRGVASRRAAPARTDAAAMAGSKPLPTFLKRGLGLGLGLHPQRFPRELLRSSERRVIACCAGSTQAEASLASSASEPSLVRAAADTSPARPHRPSDPVRQLFSLATPEEGAYRQRVSAPREPRAAEATAAPAHGGTSAPEHSSRPPSSVRRLDVGPRANAEFKQVQRDSRLRLNEALAERQRLRDSVFSLPHAHVGLTPMVLGKSRLTRSNSSAAVAPDSASAATPSSGGGAERALARRQTSMASLTPHSTSKQQTPGGRSSGGGSGGGGSGGASRSHPLGRLGRGTFWHEATSHISASDGGALRLYQAVRERAEVPRKAPPSLAPDACAALVDGLFAQLRGLLEDPHRTHAAASAATVEALFKACSPEMVGTEGAREVLLPLLRVAAEHVGVSSDDARDLQLQYAFPPETHVGSPGARRDSFGGGGSPSPNGRARRLSAERDVVSPHHTPPPHASKRVR